MEDNNDGTTFGGPRFGGPPYEDQGFKGPGFGGFVQPPPSEDSGEQAPPKPEVRAERRVIFTGTLKATGDVHVWAESVARVVPAERAILTERDGFSFALTVPQDATPDDVLALLRFVGMQADVDTVGEWFAGWLGIGSGLASISWLHRPAREEYDPEDGESETP